MQPEWRCIFDLHDGRKYAGERADNQYTKKCRTVALFMFFYRKSASRTHVYHCRDTFK